MPELKLSKKFKDHLIALNLYDEWKSELMRQWRHVENESGSTISIEVLQYRIDTDNWQGFITGSFHFTSTTQPSNLSNDKEKSNFWWKIAHTPPSN